MRLLLNFIDHKGRTGRLTFLLCLIIGWLAGSAFLLLLYALGAPAGDLRVLAFALSILLSLGPAVRRFHDMGINGWVAIGLFIPGIGWLILVLLAVFPPERVPNKWGPPVRHRPRPPPEAATPTP